MTNLLPPPLKKELLLERKQRLVVILGLTIIIPLICLILSLISLKFFILSEADAQKVVLEDAKRKYQTPDFVTFTNIIQTSNKTIGQLSSFYKQGKSFSSVLTGVLDIKKPDGLYLTETSIIRDKQGKIIVTISGLADSRENLVSFQKSLQENSQIKNLFISPQSWINAQNVKFFMTFEAVK